MFEKVLIADRGVGAVRVLRTCRALGLRTVAVHSTVDRRAPHALLADETVCVGPAAVRDSYLNARSIVAAAEVTGADAVHPGYGPLARDASFAALCRAFGVAFVGPSPDALALMADRGALGRALVAAGVPVRLEEPRALRESGGRRVIDVQLAADDRGGVTVLGMRDASVRWAGRALVEESAPVALEGPDGSGRRAVCRDLREAAARAVRAAGCSGVATVSFALDCAGGDGAGPMGAWRVAGMRAGAEPGQAATEMATGVDLVAVALRVAAGASPGWDAGASTALPAPFGYAIACQVRAEDPMRAFLACPGTMERLHLPGGMGVRVDAGCRSGSAVLPGWGYDAGLATVAVRGADRAEALAKMAAALDEMTVVGVPTNLDLLYALVRDGRLAAGRAAVGFVEKFMGDYVDGLDGPDGR